MIGGGSKVRVIVLVFLLVALILSNSYSQNGQKNYKVFYWTKDLKGEPSLITVVVVSSSPLVLSSRCEGYDKFRLLVEPMGNSYLPTFRKGDVLSCLVVGERIFCRKIERVLYKSKRLEIK